VKPMADQLCLTGGPSGGKTTMAMALTRAYAAQVQVIPEAASILFGGGFHRADFDEGIRHQQQAIYHVQSHHEAIHRMLFPQKLMICDRGTLDGHAYWPGDRDDFYKVLDTTKERELGRYKWVIHLDTAQAEGYNANSNPHRREDIHRANLINQDVFTSWEGHPQRFVIPSTRSFGSLSPFLIKYL